MPAFLIPIAGLALGALGRLMQRRRASRTTQAAGGAAVGSAVNTQPQGPPTNAISQAATTSPTPPTAQGPRRRTGVERAAEQQREDAELRARSARKQQTLGGVTQQDATVDTSGLGAQMGRESRARARKRNLEQQAALGSAATSR